MFLTDNLPLKIRKVILAIASLAPYNGIFKKKLPTGQSLSEESLKHTVDVMGIA